MNYDGSIRIDSRIDSKGFNAGIKGMIASVGKLAAAIGVAFAAAKIVAFGKSAVDAASDMASALIGLQSVVEGTGNSFTEAQEFIKSFTADGLVPAKDAIIAYKNLLLRGYDTSQVEQVLNALKDSAAFGRQGQLSMGEAISRASEGLKNENSLLVDNAGVTKNVAKMWQDYADSIGTTVGALTKQQKIQAEVNGIMEETRFQAGDAAKAAGTYAGQVSALGVSFLNFKIAVGNIFIPILTKIIPLIRAVVDGLTVLFNRLALIVSIFFGVDLSTAAASTGAIADNSQAAADAQGELADNTTKAGKAAKGALAAFDQLNVLQRDNDAAGAGPDGGEVPTLPVIDTATTDKSLDSLREKIEAFRAKLLELFAPAAESFAKLREQLQPLAETIIRGLGWAWENILVPFGKWAVESFLPKFFDLLAQGARFLNAALVVLAPVFGWLFENIFKPLAGAIGHAILWLLEQWTEIFSDLAGFLELNPQLFQTLIDKINEGWEWLQRTWANAPEFFAKIWEGIIVAFNGAGTFIITNVIGGIRSAFEAAFQWIGNNFNSMFNGIISFGKKAVNTVIDFVNAMISAIVGGINAVINALNSFQVTVPEWVPGIGGNSWALGIPTVTGVKIPRLATGAVIPPNSEFVAMLGDQRGGRNLEAPEGLIRQIIREEVGIVKGEFTFSFDGSLGALVRELKPRLDKESVRIGGSLIQSGTVK